MSYRVSPRAIEDLDRIAFEGLHRFGRNQAASYIDGINVAFKLISDFPLANRERYEIKPPQRVYPYGAHLIFYTIESGDVLITRIRHAREDWQDD